MNFAENLHRREITALERAELQARWVEITAKDKPGELRPVSKGGRGNKGGLSKASTDLGLPRSTLQQSVRIASLSPAAKEAAKASGLDDNQSALLKAAKKKTPAEQVEFLNVIAEAKSTPAPAPEPQALGAEYVRSIEDVRRLWPDSPDDYRQALREIVNED
ncbi:hypothetical protein NIK97_06745 [Brucella pseudintermedia]|uniref:Uncharacterized protein n=1 Tax=Brucella pseudintermedia TaxID=370111 RepID=A0ABY5UA80_9HYPH|nr:hypothetical protein [Brucella pseudintermedia]UWL59247.1 hypothetical protein NIK97_06745 [Brucella pseudintermedia]